MIRVLFVCLGNICRSPMAEAVFDNLVREAGLDAKIETDSAGTGRWHTGAKAHSGTIAVLEQNGIAYSGCARQIATRDFDDFDYIITMDDENLANVRRLQKAGSRAHVAPLLSYAPQTNVIEVPDPYFGGGFEGVYDLVLQGTQGLLAAIRHEHGL